MGISKINFTQKNANSLNTEKSTNVQKSSMSLFTKGAIGVAGFYGAVLVGDLLFCKGKHVKTVLSKFRTAKPRGTTTTVSHVAAGFRDFSKTTEGIRKSALTPEQTSKEMRALYEGVMEKIGIPKEMRPQLVIKKTDGNIIAHFNANSYQITISPELYTDYYGSFARTSMHEAIHCREALIRSSLPKEVAQKTVIEELSDRVLSPRESDRVYLSGNILLGKSMAPIKMSPELRKEFVQFAKENLYLSDSKTVHDINLYFEHFDGYKLNRFDEVLAKDFKSQMEKVVQTTKLKQLSDMVEKYPELVEQYGSKEAALQELFRYCLSHNNRYMMLSDNVIRIYRDGKPVELKLYETMTPEQTQYAITSLKNKATLIDADNTNWVTKSVDMKAWSNAPEEILANKNGYSYELEYVTKAHKAQEASGNMSEYDENYLLQLFENIKYALDCWTKKLG